MWLHVRNGRWTAKVFCCHFLTFGKKQNKNKKKPDGRKIVCTMEKSDNCMWNKSWIHGSVWEESAQQDINDRGVKAPHQPSWIKPYAKYKHQDGVLNALSYDMTHIQQNDPFYLFFSRFKQ